MLTLGGSVVSMVLVLGESGNGAIPTSLARYGRAKRGLVFV